MYRKEKNKKDILYILNNLRAEDKHEVIIQKGKRFRKTFTKELMGSNDYFVLGCTKNDDTPAVMGGCVSVGSGIACIWLLSTPEAINHQICLLKNLKNDIRLFDKRYWLTYNILYKENRIAKNWLKRFGYRFPASEENKTVFDLTLLHSIKVPDEFELFYRMRETRGLE